MWQALRARYLWVVISQDVKQHVREPPPLWSRYFCYPVFDMARYDGIQPDIAGYSRIQADTVRIQRGVIPRNLYVLSFKAAPKRDFFSDKTMAVNV